MFKCKSAIMFKENKVIYNKYTQYDLYVKNDNGNVVIIPDSFSHKREVKRYRMIFGMNEELTLLRDGELFERTCDKSVTVYNNGKIKRIMTSFNNISRDLVYIRSSDYKDDKDVVFGIEITMDKDFNQVEEIFNIINNSKVIYDTHGKMTKMYVNGKEANINV